eukprot:CAMPEP_0178409676 /NCGR_PEP_ID=MMETSP0689_2-20121128/20583_1 /TAXON_ID=160604 /ORGANISM="Amphidinium massartii, Strain CS-259" /LENGTH=596 /DNA_ID=CAMNT_0020030821 /DNA_START=1 /DNA_END=1791 /DNA_ORIENTATION=-
MEELPGHKPEAVDKQPRQGAAPADAADDPIEHASWIASERQVTHAHMREELEELRNLALSEASAFKQQREADRQALLEETRNTAQAQVALELERSTLQRELRELKQGAEKLVEEALQKERHVWREDLDAKEEKLNAATLQVQQLHKELERTIADLQDMHTQVGQAQRERDQMGNEMRQQKDAALQMTQELREDQMALREENRELQDRCSKNSQALNLATELKASLDRLQDEFDELSEQRSQDVATWTEQEAQLEQQLADSSTLAQQRAEQEQAMQATISQLTASEASEAAVAAERERQVADLRSQLEQQELSFAAERRAWQEQSPRKQSEASTSVSQLPPAGRKSRSSVDEAAPQPQVVPPQAWAERVQRRSVANSEASVPPSPVTAAAEHPRDKQGTGTSSAVPSPKGPPPEHTRPRASDTDPAHHFAIAEHLAASARAAAASAEERTLEVEQALSEAHARVHSLEEDAQVRASELAAHHESVAKERRQHSSEHRALQREKERSEMKLRTELKDVKEKARAAEVRELQWRDEWRMSSVAGLSESQSATESAHWADSTALASSGLMRKSNYVTAMRKKVLVASSPMLSLVKNWECV